MFDNITEANHYIEKIIFAQKSFHMLPRDENGYCNIRSIGANFFDFNGKLPEYLKINGNLKISNSTITPLPIGLFVIGDVIWDHCGLTELPDDLIVHGNIYLYGNKITKEIKSSIHGNIIMDKEQETIYNRTLKLNKLLNKNIL